MVKKLIYGILILSFFLIFFPSNLNVFYFTLKVLGAGLVLFTIIVAIFLIYHGISELRDKWKNQNIA